jgi:hypothetical protein
LAALAPQAQLNEGQVTAPTLRGGGDLTDETEVRFSDRVGRPPAMIFSFVVMGSAIVVLAPLRSSRSPPALRRVLLAAARLDRRPPI